jgi:hypothetical protein
MADFVKITKNGIIGFTLREGDYDQTTPDDVGIWSMLRCECQIDPNITLADLFWIIENNSELLELMEALYPYLNFKSDGYKSGSISVGRNFHVIGSKLVTVPKVLENLNEFDPMTTLGLDLTTRIMRKKEILGEGKDCLTLLEILEYIFLGCCDERAEIVLTKDGIYSQHVQGQCDPWEHLMHPCRIAEEVTLIDIFKIVDQNELLKLFISFYSQCGEIDAFHKLAYEKSKLEPDLFYLEIYKWFQLKKQYLHCSTEFHGIGPVAHPEVYSGDSPEHENYGISMTPINEIARIPVRLLEEVKITGLGSFKAEYTLLDILDSIYEEISYHGGPEDGKKVAEGLSGKIKKLKDRDGDTKNPPTTS